MNSRVNNHHGQASHQAEEVAQDAHSQQTQEGRKFTRFKVQHTKMQRARMLHNKKMAAAAFWKGKCFIGRDKLPSPSAQKFAKFGQKPRAESYGKAHAKDEREKDDPHLLDPKHEHNEHNEDKQKDGQGQGQGQGQEHEHEQRKQEQQHKQEQQQNQGQQHKQEQERQQNPDQGQNGGQSQQQQQQQQQQQNPNQNPNPDGQRQQQGQQGGKQPREKESRIHAVRSGKIKAVRSHALASPMQLLSKEKVGSPDLPDTLAVACTKNAARLMSQIERDGPLLLFPYLLSMMSPLRLVRSREPARLQSHVNAARAYGPAVSGKALATAELLHLSLDTTLARQGAGIEYHDDDQTGPLLKQRILDALGGASAATPKNAPDASQKTPEVRMPPAAGGATP
ncbi:MAG: helicase [Pararobbsia sp.]